MATKVESNDSILTEILLRLPVKPLLRSKSVSKRWRAFISQPTFCGKHTIRQYRTAANPFPSALLLATSPSSRCCPISPLIKTAPAAANSSNSNSSFRYLKIPRMTVKIMQSCNGLMLLEGRPIQNRHNSNNPQNARHYVYNPTTNQSAVINFPNQQFRTSVLALLLSFEPLKSSNYKIMSIRFRGFSNFLDILKYGIETSSNNVDPEYVINVYNSETGSWSEPGVCFTAPSHSSGVYSNGAVYWYADAAKSKYFDVENQCFATFPMPSRIYRDRISRYFGESGGHLHLVFDSNRSLEFDVLELKADRSDWYVKFRVDLNTVRVQFRNLNLNAALVAGLIYVFCVVRMEKEDESAIVLFFDGKVMAYNFVDRSFREIREFGNFLRDGSRFDVFHYYENISSVE